MEKLKVGDTFFLSKDVFVMVGRYCIEVGRSYEKPQDNSGSRARLKEIITKTLADEGIKHDESIVDRFVSFIAKDVPANEVRLSPGNFLVTRIEPSGANDEEVFCHRVEDPTDTVHFNQNGTYGHYRFEAIK